MIKLLLKHAIVDQCINTFFRTVAGNFHRVMAEHNKKYNYVRATRIVGHEYSFIFEYELSYYGVTFDLNDDGTVNLYSFTYDECIMRSCYPTKKRAIFNCENQKKMSYYKNLDSWIVKVHSDCYMLCFGDLKSNHTQLNPDFYSVTIIN